MDHTLDNINGFKIQQRGVGHRWMHFMASREADGAGKSHHDLGTIKAWAKGFAGWLGLDELNEKE